MKKQLVYSLFTFLSLSISGLFAVGEVSKKLIATLLPNNPIIVEAGAYNGTDSKEMSSIWPQGVIYAFEPVPHVFKMLKENTASCKNVICVQKALSDSVGQQAMHLSLGGGDQSSSLLQPVEHLYYFPHITFNNKIMVESTTLDSWAEEMNIDHVDFLWFDLQGMEPMVLKASPKIFKTVKVIYTEVSYANLYQDAPLYNDFKKWMEEQGFVVIQEVVHHSTFGDALFVRKELVHKGIRKNYE